jgi:hypothetical protein
VKKLIALLFLASSLFAQSYNLTALKSVKIEIIDEYSCLNQQEKQRLTTETKLKLISAGLQIDEINPVAAFQIRIDKNSSNVFVEPRVLLRLELLEKVQTFRSGLIRTDAKTYSNALLFQSPAQLVSENIYNYFFRYLMLEFIENYLKDNSK